MSLKFIVNHLGNSATSVSMVSGTLAEGSLNDLIAGPRSSFIRSAASASAIQPGFVLGSDLVLTHLVVARADLMVTKAGAQVRAMQRSSGGVWSAISGTTIATLAAGNLTGPTSQDLVIDVTGATNYRGFGIEFDSAGTEAMHFSKLIGGIAFDFGEPVPFMGAPTENLADDGRFVTPPRGTFMYETEREFSLTIGPVAMSVAKAFKALPLLLRWPLYLYDENADFIPWKLEHVLCLGWKEVIAEKDRHTFQISFRRLKHYQ